MSQRRPYLHDVLVAEMLRRKGLSIADAQLMAEHPELWYQQLSWNAAEEQRSRRWWSRYFGARFHEPVERLERAWFFLAFDAGLHRPDQCTAARHLHSEARDADLSRRRWLSLERAPKTFNPSQSVAPAASLATASATTRSAETEGPR